MEQYGVDDLSVDNLNIVLENLTQRRDKWQTKLGEKATQEKLINAQEIELTKKQTLHQKLSEELRNKQRNLEAEQDDLNRLIAERHSLYTDKNPDDEEKRMMARLQDLQEGFEKANDSLHAAEQELKSLGERIAAQTASTQARAQELAPLEQAFQARLTRLGFTDEAEYLDSRLDEAEYIRLQDEADKLAKAQLETSTLIQDKTHALTIERERNITDQPYSVVKMSCLRWKPLSATYKKSALSNSAWKRMNRVPPGSAGITEENRTANQGTFTLIISINSSVRQMAKGIATLRKGLPFKP